MEHKIILYGCKGDAFYIVQQHTESETECYYSLYVEVGKPENFSEEAIIEFMEENADYGSSVAGDYEQVMAELMEFLCWKGRI